MKKIIAMVFCAVLAFGGAEAVNAAPVTEVSYKTPKKKAEPVTVVFKSNIHCKNCAKKIEDNIAFEKGVTALEVSVEEKTVTVTFDPSKTEIETLRAAIIKLGYTAEIRQ